MIPGPLATVAVIAGVYGWAYLQAHRGRSLVTLAQDLGGALVGRIALTPEQARERARIEAAFAAAGLRYLAPAAVANAWAESRLDPAAIGEEADGAQSVGLFQIHDVHGLKLAERLDPEANTAWIVDEAKRRGAAEQRGQTHRALVRWFAHAVERCAACGHQDGTSQLDARERYLEQIFGPILDEVPS